MNDMVAPSISKRKKIKSDSFFGITMWPITILKKCVDMSKENIMLFCFSQVRIFSPKNYNLYTMLSEREREKKMRSDGQE